MENIINQLALLSNQFTEKDRKKYGIENLINLANKLDNEQDEYVISQMTSLINKLKVVQSDKTSKKAYINNFKQLKNYVKKTYGYLPKGSVQEEYLAFGIAFGLLIGTGFIAVNPGLLAIGLPIGVALGLSLGTSKEKALEKENKLY
jgi:hypothetical protein